MLCLFDMLVDYEGSVEEVYWVFYEVDYWKVRLVEMLVDVVIFELICVGGDFGDDGIIEVVIL